MRQLKRNPKDSPRNKEHPRSHEEMEPILADAAGESLNNGLIQTVAILLAIVAWLSKEVLGLVKKKKKESREGGEVSTVIDLLRKIAKETSDLWRWHEPQPDQDGQPRFQWYESNRGVEEKLDRLIQLQAETRDEGRATRDAIEKLEARLEALERKLEALSSSDR